MAHPSPSPSTDQARRLCELLEEQQEPFSLDVYLSEKGYSTKFLDLKTTTTCWPGNEKKILNKFTTNGLKSLRRSERDGGFLKGVRSKILHQKYANKSSNQERITSFSDRFYVDEMEKDFEQFSPVSVLELRSSYESSPVSSQREEEEEPKTLNIDPQIMNIFKELLEAAYTSEFDKFTQNIVQEQHKKNPNLNQMRIWESTEKKEKMKREKERADSLESHRLELERLSKLICQEISETPKWTDFNSQVREIATEIEDTIFEELVGDLLWI
ncbi:hypothetical protein LUZ60_004698 [Juncus effusus]|nr:hypothetical protein LUZ60_004698 [Juncus effusus]